MIVVSGRVKVREDSSARLRALAGGMLAPSRAEPGCLWYGFYEDPTTPGGFLFFEEWKSRAALDAHFQTRHFQAFSQALAPLLNGDPVVKIYEVASVESA